MTYCHRDLSENGITAIASGVFDPLSKLQTLYLTTNRIAQPLPVSGLPSTLVYLWCGVNQIPSITPGTFDSLSQLRTLWLGANQLTALPAHIFDHLTVLKALDLGQNQLQRLPVGVFDYLTSLNTLLLWVNLLTTVAPGTFRALTQLQSLTISSNPLLVTLDAYLFQSLSNYDPTATLDVSYSMTDLVCVPYPPPITFVAPAAYITAGPDSGQTDPIATCGKNNKNHCQTRNVDNNPNPSDNQS
ncbi:hypothetical protein PBRA_008081 [Plasmodiophora brassicae]|uniref:Uncharacterized protein n=1 Tax=Plasmodiophora brassicae TaxID=37360 RepID=A0A0G4J0B0_PLABS|nr:hypothetical protein PBRA_008081 [Plasmodiophora brassicae]